MKKILIALAYVTLVACGTQTKMLNKAATPKVDSITWPIEPTCETAGNLICLDRLDAEIMGDARNVDPILAEVFAQNSGKGAEDVVNGIQEVYDEAEQAWRKFVWLCNEGRELEAVEFYRDNRIYVDISIANSDVRMMFHDDVLGFLAYDNLPNDEAVALMIDAFEFDRAMFQAKLDGVVVDDEYMDYPSKIDYDGLMCITKEEYDEIVTAYNYAVSVLIQLYHISDRISEASDLAREWGHTVYRDKSRNIREAMISLKEAEYYISEMLYLADDVDSISIESIDIGPYLLRKAMRYINREMEDRNDGKLETKYESLNELHGELMVIYNDYYDIVE